MQRVLDHQMLYYELSHKPLASERREIVNIQVDYVVTMYSVKIKLKIMNDSGGVSLR